MKIFISASILWISVISTIAAQANETKIDRPQQWTIETESKVKSLNTVRAAIRKYHLSDLMLKCILLEEEKTPNNSKFLVTVREKHGGDCGGDPNTSRRLFSIQLETKTGKLWSDANSETGEFEALSR